MNIRSVYSDVIEEGLFQFVKYNAYLIDGDVLMGEWSPGSIGDMDEDFDTESLDAVILLYDPGTIPFSLKSGTRVYTPSSSDLGISEGYRSRLEIIDLREGETYSINGYRMQPIRTPLGQKYGGYISMYLPDEKVVFTPILTGIEHMFRNQREKDDYLEGLRKLSELDMGKIYPTTQPHPVEDPYSEIQEAIERAEDAEIEGFHAHRYIESIGRKIRELLLFWRSS